MKSDTSGTLTSPGFRILREQDKLAIIRDLNPSLMRKRMVTLGVCGAFSSTIYIVEFVRISKGAQFAAIPWFLLSICSVAPLLFALRVRFPGDDGLVGTRESLQVTRTFRTKARDVRIFQAADVTRLQYVAEIFPWFGAAGSLGFLAEGKQVTCLSGLKHSDVQMILAELQRMGFDVKSDPEAIEEGPVEDSGREK